MQTTPTRVQLSRQSPWHNVDVVDQDGRTQVGEVHGTVSTQIFMAGDVKGALTSISFGLMKATPLPLPRVVGLHTEKIYVERLV